MAHGPTDQRPKCLCWYGLDRGWEAECATARSPADALNLAGFCRDPSEIRDNPSNSGSYTPPAPRVHHITNIDDDGGVPTNPTPNWPQYNNFRSGDLSPADGLVAPDLQMLTPEACLSDCDDDLLNVWVQLGNTGAGPLLAGATIDVYGTVMGVESLLFSVDVPLALQPGEFADAFSIPVDLTDLEQIRLVAAPKETECKIDMANEIVIVPPFCTNPG